MPSPASWLRVTPAGLYVEPGDFHIDPTRPVAKAVITHGHGDHARPGHGAVLATPPTLAIMRSRFGEAVAGSLQPLEHGQSVELGGVRVRLAPAGHILGSAQVVLEHAGCRVVISGDYKRRADATCLAFEPVACDLFVTEATFGLPVFRHPPDRGEVDKLLHSLELFPESCHVVGVYPLGKCQRLICLLRQAGYDAPIWLHGALVELCRLYEAHGVALGDLRHATAAPPKELAGRIVLCPPSAIADRWTRRLPERIAGFASGWMRVKQRAKQRGVELPLIISDHADWDELNRTIDDVAAPEIWVTHGREEALVHQAQARGLKAQALALVGFEEEEGE